MNEAQEKLLENIFEGIKEEGLHFASALLTKLAVHINNGVVKAQVSDTQPTCPQGQTWSESLKKCVDDPA